MKQGVSSLNPYAASYIPLSKRNANGRTFETAKNSRSGNESSRFVTPEQLHYRAYYDSNAHGTEKAPIPEVGSAVKSHHAYGYGSSPQNVNQAADKQMLDEFDIDLEYLQMSFPGISDQSLTDVYAANRGDLEATVDMLNQLEVYNVTLLSLLKVFQTLWTLAMFQNLDLQLIVHH
ncbi:polyadenylate-binding protein-interacting protein 5 isoform X2 [Quercus suber]|uniref:polyadenylate-binding protein-interacting protein 5 isoform X2 n=1 Tax=Quercus suber TaxID=58331 RepID=UPI000CE175D6|nr:polyadenylate-binding protein-interacting protein 5-like isoform X2 [Quercus suber]